jgi:hypothetical protein
MADVPDIPTAPMRALDLARRGIPVARFPAGLLDKALAFVRTMEQRYLSEESYYLTATAGEWQRAAPYRPAVLVALTVLAGRPKEAGRRLDLAILRGEDPCALWLDPDIVLLGDPPEIQAVFAKHGIRMPDNN